MELLTYGAPTILLALLVFGFAPGLLLRMIVLLFQKGDPRRRELVAELYAVPRWDQLFWVAQHLELALVEGCLDRLWTRRHVLRAQLNIYDPTPQVFEAEGPMDLPPEGWTGGLWVRAPNGDRVLLPVRVTRPICATHRGKAFPHFEAEVEEPRRIREAFGEEYAGRLIRFELFGYRCITVPDIEAACKAAGRCVM